VKVRLDVETCVGHGRCYALAPDVFDADEHGHCVLRFGDGGEIPPELHDAARLGVGNCPEEALAVDE
jgi:ferredoxin